MFKKLMANLTGPFHCFGNYSYYSLGGDELKKTLEILGLTQNDVNTDEGTAETLQIQTRDGAKFATIIGFPEVETEHKPIHYATKEVPLLRLQ